MPKATFPEETTDWGQLSTTVEVNKADLAYLEPQSSRSLWYWTERGPPSFARKLSRRSFSSQREIWKRS